MSDDRNGRVMTAVTGILGLLLLAVGAVWLGARLGGWPLALIVMGVILFGVAAVMSEAGR